MDPAVIRARVHCGPNEWARNQVRILVQDEGRYILQDGRWLTLPEGQAIPEDVGILLPARALDAIRAAILEHMGEASDAPTEVRVLREALEVERTRVDRAWDATLVATGGLR